MKRTVLLLVLLLLLPQVATAKHAISLYDAYKEYFAQRSEVINNWVEAQTTVDSFAMQRLQTSISDTLIVMDDWEVDKCWLPWYAIARAEFEIQVEVFTLAAQGWDPTALQNMLLTSINLKHLNETLFFEAVKECNVHATR